MKGVGLDSTPSYGGCMYHDAKSTLKHLVLMQDYQELKEEVEVIKEKLDTTKQRKLTLAAEVRFLQRKHRQLLKTKILNSSQEQQHIQQVILDQTKNCQKKTSFSRNEMTLHMLPPIPDPKSKGKLSIGKESVLCYPSPFAYLKSSQILLGGNESSHCSSIPVHGMNSGGRINFANENVSQSKVPFIDLNYKEGILHANDVTMRNSTIAFDLNQDSKLDGKQARLRSRAPLFDLNEISTGDEDFQTYCELPKFEEAKKGFTVGVNNEQQHIDLKLSLCRNAGEGSSRGGKRKISWQDQVALRV